MEIFGIDLSGILIGLALPIATVAGFNILAGIIKKLNPVVYIKKTADLMQKHAVNFADVIDKQIEATRKKSPELAQELDGVIIAAIDSVMVILTDIRQKFN